MTQKFSSMRNFQAAIMIQAAFRGFWTRKQTVPRLKARAKAMNFVANKLGKRFRERMRLRHKEYVKL